MKRRNFIKNTLVTLAASQVVGLNALGKELDDFSPSETMPLLFVGHGSPMNAIEQNEYSKVWQSIGTKLPRPQAILCISAHWLTRGTFVTAMEQPRTIHDFGGFPQALFEAEYLAPGAPELAKEASKLVHSTQVGLDYDWGYDHGTWSVLKPMFPQANIPVFQLSIDYHQSPAYQYALAQELKSLRQKGVLIIGSGNIVHNLRMIRMEPEPYDWALEFDQKIKGFLNNRDHQAIIDYQKLGKIAQLAVPTPDHYYPMLYILGLAEPTEPLQYFNAKTSMGSISMRSFQIG